MQRSSHDDCVCGCKKLGQIASDAAALMRGSPGDRWVLNNTYMSKKEVQIELLAASQ
ncbi:hypothetical protein [Chamaesiphon sp. VAR_69_metabat_338]|uniref:hypothetical protein n=1 Tax=Chamaesiphon sp. VAR_69_metabat_338 TaxID=2964704 RepID=UPI00286E2390|nr:hypothetical protein [Chamaesiphon sp. VAR_69_metabat_338]